MVIKAVNTLIAASTVLAEFANLRVDSSEANVKIHFFKFYTEWTKVPRHAWDV